MRHLRYIAMGALCCLVVVVVWHSAGCGQRQDRPQSTTNVESRVCPPNATFCPVPERLTLTADSQFFARLAEPIEVDAMVHTADGGEPFLGRVWVDGGTWLVPRGMMSVDNSGAVVTSGPPFFLQAGTR